MQIQNSRPIIFISHMSADREVSNALEDLIHVLFGDSVLVFNSSNDTSITGGDDWRQKIRENLLGAMAVLVVFTPESIDRAWVNFEAGGAWVQEGKFLIPCCANGLTLRTLPSVVKNLQGYELIKSDHLTKLIKKLDERIGMNPRRTEEISTEFAEKFYQISKSYQEAKEIENRKKQLVELENQKRNIDVEIESLKRGSETSSSQSDIQNLKSIDPEQNDRETFLIKQMISVDYDHLNPDPDEKYLLRYKLGSWLGELQGLSDEELLSLTEPISLQSRGRSTTFYATKYLITRRLVNLAYNSDYLSKENYLPYIHTVGDDTDFEQWYASIQDLINWIKQEYFIGYSEVRLPTHEEWVTLAQPITDWSFEAVRKCNVKMGEDEHREISAVGAFPSSKSRYGCQDVIGNVWELCTENFQPKIAGWSYKNLYRANWDWTSIRGVRGARGFDIGFRLIVK